MLHLNILILLLCDNEGLSRRRVTSFEMLHNHGTLVVMWQEKVFVEVEMNKKCFKTILLGMRFTDHDKLDGETINVLVKKLIDEDMKECSSRLLI